MWISRTLVLVYPIRTMKKLGEYKHFFFDLDETVTPSRSVILPHAKELMGTLPVDIAIISGLAPDVIKKHIDGLRVITMGQNGNCAFDYEGNQLWNDVLTETEKNKILSHISQIVTENDFEWQDEADIIEDRDSQIAYSLIGHHEDVARKKLSDPKLELRQHALATYPLVDDAIEVRISGSTTLDYLRKGSHKGTNVARLIKHYGWNKDDCLYFGDRLHPGGNDEPVIGVIDTVAVVDHEHTYQLLKEAFNRPKE